MPNPAGATVQQYNATPMAEAIAGEVLEPAEDAAVDLTYTVGAVVLQVNSAANTAITTSSSYKRQRVHLFALSVAGGGSYTLDLASGDTLTLNATSESAVIARNEANDGWVVVGLSGATIV